MKKCFICGAINNDDKYRCHCGYEFSQNGLSNSNIIGNHDERKDSISEYKNSYSKFRTYNRKQFIITYIAVSLIYIIPSFLYLIIDNNKIIVGLLPFAALISLIFQLNVVIKRLKVLNISPWAVLLLLIPIINILLVIYLAIAKAKDKSFGYIIFQWIIAIIITLGISYYLRISNQTKSIEGTILIDKNEIKFKLPRTYNIGLDTSVRLSIQDTAYKAYLLYRQHKTDSQFTRLSMQRQDTTLIAFLPNQNPGVKLEYFIELQHGNNKYTIPNNIKVVALFKDSIPMGVLLPHIIIAFFAVIYTNVTLLEALFKGTKVVIYSLITVVFILFGDLFLGPIVNNYAFGKYLTGVPFNFNIAENKYLYSFICWIITFFAIWKFDYEKYRWWVVGASLFFLILLFI